MMGNRRVSGLQVIFICSFLVVTAHSSSLGGRNSTVSCDERERLALLKFKHDVNDYFKMLSSWVGTDCCSWEGIHCDGATGSVVGLHLRGRYRDTFENYKNEFHYLKGDKMNANLAELRHLKHLDLSGNIFQGCQIPEFIGSFKKLSYLNLSDAAFIGLIPHQIGNLSNLKVLDLSSSSYYMNRNRLTINDMSWVSKLSSLEHLDLGDVHLFKPTTLHMIPSLRYLSLSGCGVSNADLRGLHLNSSKILPNIEYLDLSFNSFEGKLPLFFQNMTSLVFLDLSSYNLSLAHDSLNILNTIPSLLRLHLSGCQLQNAHFSPTYLNVSVHSKIRYLDLSLNSIEGRFPSELMNLTSLRALDLSSNALNSFIPTMPTLILKLDVSFNKFENIELVGVWRQCHLKELRLSGNFLGGEMIGASTNMSECSQYALEMLDSSRNKLNGSIPKDFERFGSLKVLNLASNDLNGPIPTFLVKLTELKLFGNKFSGSIPESLGRLTGLTDLDLGFNELTGPIPTSLGRLTSLRSFSVYKNLLNGTIPLSVGKLTKLAYFVVSNNNLEGVVSEAHFANLSMLKYLHTSDNAKLIFNISHEWIPPFQLRVIELSSCKIAYGFPQWLQKQREIQTLGLSNTSLHGILPTWLRKMPFIYYIDLSHNKLSGPLKNLPSIKRSINVEPEFIIYLQDNLFNGSIPRSLCRRVHLIFLDVSMNKLTGNIHECVANLQHMPKLAGFPSSLQSLKLNDNNFDGELPRDIENLEFLEVLDLGNNKFSGSIPQWIGESLTFLVVLRLHKNNFTGIIPQSLCKCSRLHILDVAHNSLIGSIPHCFGKFNEMIGGNKQGFTYINSEQNLIQVMKGTDLEYTNTLDLVFNMDLSSNKLTGEIPSGVTILSSLMGLNLSHNRLSGSIPYNIGNMKALISFDLSDNQFTGMIPQSLGALNFLSFLNLSNNNLSGRIPTGNQLQTLIDPSIYAGNMDLCGAPLPNNCSNHENPPTTMSKNVYEDDDNGSKKVLFYLDIMCGFATGFWGIIGMLCFKKKWRQKLFNMAELTVDKVFVAVVVRVSKIKRGTREILSNDSIWRFTCGVYYTLGRRRTA